MENQLQTTGKSWLQRLKDESWEAELLVSVASIFAIFKAFKLLDWLVDYFIDQLIPEQYFYGYMICFLGYIAFGVLGAFFVIHFGLRAYWIGLVGLNSVFPDYNLKESAYSKVYTEKMSQKLPKLRTTINVLDEVCSVIFSAAFTLLLIYIYAGVLTSVYLVIFNLLKNYIPTIILLIPVAIFSILYVVMTLWSILANLKKFKENTKIQTWYYHIAIWGSKLFYGPLYKYSLQTTMIFGSNFKKKKALVKTIGFMIVIGMVLGVYQIFQSNVMYLLTSDLPIDESRLFSNYYNMNNKESNFLITPEISDEIITKRALKLFVPLFDYETDIMEKNCEIPDFEFGPKNDLSRQKRWQANLECYASGVAILLDGEKTNIDFLKTDHSVTNQLGLQGIVNLKEITEGPHRLKVVKTISSETKKEWTIPFYYAPN